MSIETSTTVQDLGSGGVQEDIVTPEEQLLKQRNSLAEMLGSTWKERCIFDSVEDVFTPEELEGIQHPEIIENPDSSLTKKCEALNEILTQQPGNFRASIFVDNKGLQRIFITGNVGDDNMFQVIETCQILDSNNSTEAFITPNRYGFVTKNGKVVLLNKLLPAETPTEVCFVVKSNGRFEGNTQEGEYVVSEFPSDLDAIASLFHELGHRLRFAKQSKDYDTVEANNESWMINRNKIDYDKIRYISTSHNARKIETLEERGSWALGVNILKSLYREAGLELGNTTNLINMIKEANNRLYTYDRNVPYKNEEPLKPTPSFSRTERKDARELQRAVQTIGIDPDRVTENFDYITGVKTGTIPSEKLKYVRSIADDSSNQQG